MALCRCLESHSWPVGRRSNYVSYVLPIGYPDTALVCGLCLNPGVIWLTESEEAAYHQGNRIFTGPNAFCQMKASDNGVNKRPGIIRPILQGQLYCEHTQSLSEDWINEKLSCINRNEIELLHNIEEVFNQRFNQEDAHLTPHEFTLILRFKGPDRVVPRFMNRYANTNEVEQVTRQIFQNNLHEYGFEQVINNEDLQHQVLETANQLMDVLTQLEYVGVSVASAALRLAFPHLFGTADWIVPGLLHCLHDDDGNENPFIANLGNREQFEDCLLLTINGHTLAGHLTPYQSRNLATENYIRYIKELWRLKTRFRLTQTIANIEMSIWSYGICYVKKQNRQDNLPFRFLPADAPSPPVRGPFRKNCPNF